MLSGNWSSRILVLAAASLMFAVAIGGFGIMETAQPLQPSSVRVEGLFPAFDPGETQLRLPLRSRSPTDTCPGQGSRDGGGRIRTSAEQNDRDRTGVGPGENFRSL